MTIEELAEKLTPITLEALECDPGTDVNAAAIVLCALMGAIEQNREALFPLAFICGQVTRHFESHDPNVKGYKEPN